MNEDLKEEVIEEIRQEVTFGFNEEEDIVVAIEEMFYEEEIDTDWLEQEVSKIYNQRKEEAKQWKRPTDFDRLVAAFDQLNKEKIVSLHRAGYTQSDGIDDAREVASEVRKKGIAPFGYCFYHTQDLMRAVETNNLYLSFGGRDDVGIGKDIVSILKQHGFETEWNGTKDTRILIKNIVWQKFPDGEDYGMNRSMGLLVG
ncbi:MAG: hypothetical protein LUE98_16310 [Tannerellaceae bacterium]|nr:hypothetical protein [Tannerellaceae bacterium]MCD8178878.1 hypothetical protein [Tannerellaceae bacterium]